MDTFPANVSSWTQYLVCCDSARIVNMSPWPPPRGFSHLDPVHAQERQQHHILANPILGGQFLKSCIQLVAEFCCSCMKKLPKEVVVSVKERLPLVNHRVIVVCQQFRCLGYLDNKGIWRDDAKSRELRDVIGWMDFSNALNDTRRFHRPNAGR